MKTPVTPRCLAYNLRPVYKMQFYDIHYRVVACILEFLVHRKYTLTLHDMKTFLLWILSNGVSKNPSFYTAFKDVHLTFTLVKNAPKNRFLGDFLYRNIFLGHNFFGCTFYIYIFEISMKRRIFDNPFDNIQKTSQFLAKIRDTAGFLNFSEAPLILQGINKHLLSG